MRLHENEEDFRDLCSITAGYIGIPEDAVRRDYYIVSMLQKLEKSEFADCCVFKGGTSLSKCYPGSIERFSEDIDLTFLASGLSKKQYDKSLKKIEKIMTNTYKVEIIPEERNDRNKSSYVFFGNNDKLKLGDKVYITDNSGTKLKYNIYNIYETSPDDGDFIMRETNGKREISLQTCTDNSKGRLIIWAVEE